MVYLSRTNVLAVYTQAFSVYVYLDIFRSMCMYVYILTYLCILIYLSVFPCLSNQPTMCLLYRLIDAREEDQTQRAS